MLFFYFLFFLFFLYKRIIVRNREREREIRQSLVAGWHKCVVRRIITYPFVLKLRRAFFFSFFKFFWFRYRYSCYEEIGKFVQFYIQIDISCPRNNLWKTLVWNVREKWKLNRSKMAKRVKIIKEKFCNFSLDSGIIFIYMRARKLQYTQIHTHICKYGFVFLH